MKARLILICTILGLAALMPLLSLRHVAAQSPAIELACPAGATAIPQGVMINPVNGKIRQLLCMDSSGNLNLPSPVTFPALTTISSTSPFTVSSLAGVATIVTVTDGNAGNATLFTIVSGGNIGIQGRPGAHLNQIANANSDIAGKLTCSGSTVSKAYSSNYTSTPMVQVFDETTKGGANLTANANTGFTVSCTGATDALDYFVIGNPN
jgi:hypothetical protein